MKAIVHTILFLVMLFLCFCTDSSTKNESTQYVEIHDPHYLELGKSYASKTQALLAKKLQAAIIEGGSAYAVQFCNTEAIGLTDSMALILKVSIKRVSDKPRNSKNKANDFEALHLTHLKDKILKNESPSPKVVLHGKKVIGLYPIITNTMCLQCHGKKLLDINESTTNKLKELYPYDEATEYTTNQIRGLWVVEMNKH